MPAVGTAAAAAAVTGGTLFEYNRKNYMYDRTMRLETEYQIMEMQINKQDMFREDVRDIVELTEVKMDTYTIITVIQLGFCIVALCEGRLGHGSPAWLISMHTLTLCTAFSYFLLSVWFAMHATIAACAYKVRLVTQIVRLPIPSWAQLEGARTYASTFEKTDARQMFRVPFLCGKQEDVAKGGCFPSLRAKESSSRGEHRPAREETSQSIGSQKEDSQMEGTGTAEYKNMPTTDPWGLERSGANIYELDGTLQTDPRKLRHIQLVRESMQYWVASDAFARVTMSIGTQLFALGLSYYVIGYVLIINHAIVGAWLAVALFVSVAWAVFRIDMSLTMTEYIIALVLLLCSPVCVLVSSTLWAMDREGLAIQVLMPIAFLAQVLWLVFLLYICKVAEQKNGVMLPTGYRAVLYIDVFGWIKRNVASTSAAAGPSTPASPAQLPEPEELAGTGPAIQGVRYEDRRPVPMRIEQLSGANRPPNPADLSTSAFAPSTFVPPSNDAESNCYDNYEPGTAGRKPWLVFFYATSFFATLWVVSLIIITLQLHGRGPFQREQVQQEGPVSALLELDRNPEWLQLGPKMSTVWPHANVNPIGLACDGASKTMVVSSRFGLYTADLSSQSHIQFKAAPVCEDVEGESLLDVSLQCDTRSPGSACQAVVLHQKGRRLAVCALGETSGQQQHASNSTEHVPSVTSIAGQWLSGNSASGKVHVQSLALSSHCPGREHECAFVGTNDQRIIEMQKSLDGKGSQALFPKRLFGTKASVLSSVSSGAMDLIHNRYLAFLQRDGRRLEAFDLQRGGVIAGLWRLPNNPDNKAWIPDGKAWTAMCTAGDDLYLLSKGLSPQLWRLPLPQALRKEAAMSVGS